MRRRHIRQVCSRPKCSGRKRWRWKIEPNVQRVITSDAKKFIAGLQRYFVKGGNGNGLTWDLEICSNSVELQSLMETPSQTGLFFFFQQKNNHVSIVYKINDSMNYLFTRPHRVIFLRYNFRTALEFLLFITVLL